MSESPENSSDSMSPLPAQNQSALQVGDDEMEVEEPDIDEIPSKLSVSLARLIFELRNACEHLAYA